MNRQIRHKIVTLDLPPGNVIDEGQLQSELALGRTPIREALQRLSHERLVQIDPRRGMFVTDIGFSDLQRLVEVRLVLEAEAARLAAERGTAVHWQQMETALNLLDDAQDSSPERLIMVDEACPHIMYEATNNPFLQDTLTVLYAQRLRLWHYALAQVPDMHSPIAEHLPILHALRSGQANEASNLLRQHVLNFQEEITAVVLGQKKL